MKEMRHEEYASFTDGLPFSIGLDIQRSPYNLSKEQNWHENIEIQFFTQGCGSVLIDGEKYEVGEGDIVAVNSNILHYTFTDTSLTYTCIIISTDWCKRMGIDHGCLRFHALISDSGISEAICALVQVYRDKNDKLRALKLNGLLISIMTQLITQHCDTASPTAPKSKAAQAVTCAIEYIHNNFSRRMTLADIAKAALFDKYALCREFRRHTGQTVFGYTNRYRSLRAAELLREGNTVTASAGLCGFENLSFFTKTFKKHLGTTPSEYKMRSR